MNERRRAEAPRRSRLARWIAAAALLAGVAWLLRPLPADLLAPVTGTRVLDRDGALLVHRPAPERAPGQPRRLEELGEDLVAATLAAEDHRFRLHPGLDPVGIARAARNNLRAGRVVEGGSTITQQLARNLVPRGPGLPGKLGEAALAVRLEAWLSKDAILAEYLSRVSYGNTAIGADAAARLYFDRPPAALSLAQAATLAALPRRPTDLDPLRFPLRARDARDRVLRRMERRGLAAPERVAEALAEPLGLVSGPPVGKAPHFVRRVWSPTSEIRTTLDLDLQVRAEEIVQEVLAAIRPHRASQAAVLVVHNPSRDVLAYVGSADWRARDGQVDGVMAPRSSGSALKPFLYALAIEEGATYADVVADAPGTWSTTHGSWRPENYDRSSAGPVTLRDALARSLNVPAARLAERVGVADLHRRLGALGFTTLTERPDHYGLSLPLGGAEVRLDELAAAYATFASGGRWRPLRFRLDDPRPAPRPVMTPAAAFATFDVLDDDAARAPAFGRGSALEPGFPMAAKTGTSTGWRDNWAVGVTEALTVAVWVGNFDGSPMVDISGVTGAGPILAGVMAAAMEGRSADAPDPPATLTRRAVCPLSGLPRGAWCPDTRDEWFPARLQRPACHWHGPEGLAIPSDFAAWAGRNGFAVRADGGRVRIAAPADGAVFWLERERPADDQGIPLVAEAPAGTTGRWEIDGETVASVGPPFAARWVPREGEHTVRLVVDGVAAEPVHIRVGAGP